MTIPVLDRAFAALSDPTRREIVHQLAKGAARVTDLAEPFDMSFNAVSKHVKVLERAGLVRRTRAGREHRIALDPEPIRRIAGWASATNGRGAPAAAGVRVDVGSDARARVPGDHRDDAVPRRHRPGVDAQRAPRRRDGSRPRGGLEALHRHPGREDQRAAVRKEGRAMPTHMTGTRNEWLAARPELLEAEKELTRRGERAGR